MMSRNRYKNMENGVEKNLLVNPLNLNIFARLEFHDHILGIYKWLIPHIFRKNPYGVQGSQYIFLL